MIDRFLELVKEKALSVTELQIQLWLSNVTIDTLVRFLIDYGFVYKEDSMISITEAGMKLLNLPDLTGDKLPLDQMEILEQFWAD